MKSASSSRCPISVLVISWNVRDQLGACLTSLAEACGDADEIIVVDNASADGSIEMVRERFPGVRTIRNEVNRNFVVGNNQGFAESVNPIILLLNPDTIVPPFALDSAAAAFASHPDLGALGFKMINSDGSLQSLGRDEPDLLNTLAQWFLPYRLYARLASWTRFARKAASSSTLVDVPSLSGSALCIRRVALGDEPLFDEQVPLFAEDVDLVYRIRRRGWRVGCLTGVPIIHFGGRSWAQNPMHAKVAFPARRAFLLKHGTHTRFVDAAFFLAIALRVAAWSLLSEWRPGIKNAARTRDAYSELLKELRASRRL